MHYAGCLIEKRTTRYYTRSQYLNDVVYIGSHEYPMYLLLLRVVRCCAIENSAWILCNDLLLYYILLNDERE